MNNIVPARNAQLPADPAQMQELYAQYAAAYAEPEKRAGSRIVYQNGVMSIGDQAVPGAQVAAIILDGVILQTFYTSGYNPNTPTSPTCYAIGRTPMDMVPSPDMAKAPQWFKAQADRCSACPHNPWGSAGRQGSRAKACKEVRRLEVMLMGTYSAPGVIVPMAQDFVQHIAAAPILGLNLPSTSIANWGELVRKTQADYQRPPFAFITRIFGHQHPEHDKEAIGFEIIAPVPDDWAPAILARLAEAQGLAMEGYDAPTAPPAQQAGGGFYGAQQAAVQPFTGFR